MLTEYELSQLGPLGRLFRERLLRANMNIVFKESVHDGYSITIPAVHPEVGDLSVRDDGEELTIDLGVHHWHVSSWLFPADGNEQQAQKIVSAAIDAVQDVLADKIIVRVRRSNGQVTSTMSYTPDYERRFPLQPGEHEYCWTGPLPTGPREAV